MKLTNVQRKMLKVLSDGLPHTRQELHACLHDELGPLTNIYQHVSCIRKWLKQRGQTVLCEYVQPGRKKMYRHVKLLKCALLA